MKPLYTRGTNRFSFGGEKARFWERIPVFPADKTQLSKLPLYIWQAGISECDALYSRARANTSQHRQFAIELVTAGNIEVIQNGKSIIVEAGEIYLVQIDSTTEWKSGPAGFAHKRFVSIEGSLLEAMLRTMNLLYCTHIKPDSPTDLYRLMKQSNRVMYEGNLEKNMSLACEILILLGKYVRRSEEHPSLRLAIDYLNRHLHDIFYNRDVARASNVSVSHLNLLFNRHYNLSPIQYFLHVKIEHAKLLLLNRNFTLKQISEQLGYDDPYFFSRQFKKFAGVSPQRYRTDLDKVKQQL
jgi:AraC-like DNA-binding protein